MRIGNFSVFRKFIYLYISTKRETELMRAMNWVTSVLKPFQDSKVDL